MASLFFPQLSSGALVQYPIRKTRHLRTVLNVLPDGSIIPFQDPGSSRLTWELVYQHLAPGDRDLLQNHFAACSGPWLPFVFIDPTENMLSDSSVIGSSYWQVGPSVNVQAGAPDPFGSNQAFVITNYGEIAQEISQTLNVPASYQYCFSVYVWASLPSTVGLIRSADSTQIVTVSASPTWQRAISSGQLPNETATFFTVAISLAAGQQIAFYGPQLEPQSAPSRYRPTAGNGGVYSNAHWAINNLTFTAESPSLFNTNCAIDASTA